MNLKIHLSISPLDDYQRTIFSDTPNHTIPSSNQWPATIFKTSYTTNLVQNINDIPILGKEVFEQILGINTARDNHVTKKRKKKNRILHCQEYRFPDLGVRSAYIAPNMNNIENIFGKKLNEPSNSLISDNNNHAIGFVRDGILSRSTVDNVVVKSGDSENAPGLIKKSLVTKHEAYKESRSNASNIIFDTGCNVIWSEDTGFVYMTGIWKIYQKVMEGLVTMDRNSIYGSEDSKQLCLNEWNIISTNIFGRRYPSYSHSDHSSNNRSSGRKGEKVDYPDRKNGEPIQTNNIINPFDFNWEKVDHHIREQLLEYYKSYLIRVRNISPSVLQSMKMFDIAQKLRGGYTHIQGTWLPIQLARRLCLMFAYPIRYLLIPLFGSTFPEDCEGWYKFYEANNRQMKAFIIPFDSNPGDKPNYETASVVANTFNNNSHLTTDPHFSNLDPNLLNTRKDNPERYTDIIESQSDQHQPIIPSVFSKGYGLPGQSKVVSRENNYFLPGKKPFKIRKGYHQNTQISENKKLATHESHVQSESCHALNDNKNIIHTKCVSSKPIYNPAVDTAGYIGPVSVGEGSLMKPSNTPNGLINHGYPTNIPNFRFPPSNQKFGFIGMGAQNRNNTLLPVTNLPVLYNDIPNQRILYHTSNNPGFLDSRTIIIAPTQPNVYNGTDYYPPNLASGYMNPIGRHLPPTISTSNTSIPNYDNNIPHQILRPSYPSLTVPDTHINTNIFPHPLSFSTHTQNQYAYTPNGFENEMHSPTAINTSQDPRHIKPYRQNMSPKGYR